MHAVYCTNWDVDVYIYICTFPMYWFKMDLLICPSLWGGPFTGSAWSEQKSYLSNVTRGISEVPSVFNEDHPSKQAYEYGIPFNLFNKNTHLPLLSYPTINKVTIQQWLWWRTLICILQILVDSWDEGQSIFTWQPLGPLLKVKLLVGCI